MGEYENTQVETRSGVEERFKDLYQPAVASKRVIEYLAENPFCERTVLSSSTNLKSYQEKYPEVVHLAGVVLDTRTQVERTYVGLREETGRNGKKITTVLYEAAQGKDSHGPDGPIEMGYLDNPFALVMVANKVDFARLDARDIGGYYNKGLQVAAGLRQYTVPFIAIQNGIALTKEQILSHEMKHAYNDKIMQSFGRVRKANLWGAELILNPNERTRISETLLKVWNDNNQNPDRKGLVRSNPHWRRMLGHSLSDIKDEVVVRLMTGEPMEPVTVRFDAYDVLQRDFQFAQNEVFSSYIWETYLGIVNSEVSAARKAMDTYSSFGLHERAEVLPWMLMRIPLGSWKAELNSVGITSEVGIIENITKSRKSTFVGRALSVKKEDTELRKFVSNQDGLLVPQLVEYWERTKKG